MGEYVPPQGRTACSVPHEAQRVFLQQVLSHPRISKHLPEGLLYVSHKIRFSGSDSPRLPINWRVAKPSAALHSLVAALSGLLLAQKYGVSAPEVEINTYVLYDIWEYSP